MLDSWVHTNTCPRRNPVGSLVEDEAKWKTGENSEEGEGIGRKAGEGERERVSAAVFNLPPPPPPTSPTPCPRNRSLYIGEEKTGSEIPISFNNSRRPIPCALTISAFFYIVKHFYYEPVARGSGRPPPLYLTLNKLPILSYLFDISLLNKNGFNCIFCSL